MVTQGTSGRREVTLTFDAGSDAGHTREILRILAEQGVPAIFGLTGAWAQANPGLVREITAAGHTLINHSYDHSSFTGLSSGLPALSREERWRQLDRTEEVILGLTGVSTIPYFRPPFGDWDDSVNQHIAQRGYAFNVMWTVDSRGWQGLPADEIISRCLELAAPGAIYIFHVGAASADAAALPGIIDGLRKEGYAFVLLAGLIAE